MLPGGNCTTNECVLSIKVRSFELCAKKSERFGHQISLDVKGIIHRIAFMF